MYQRYFKRIIDIILSLIVLPIVLIIIVIVGILIKLEDNGSIIYKDLRLGEDLKPFKMYKLRSMKVDAPDIRNSDGTTFNSENDSRVTKVGKIIRKTSLDEVPQFINVLMGDMSFVGPRPSPLGDKSIYPKEFFEKFKVKPGITGYNQAILRNNATMEQRIKNDCYYVNNVSLKLDVYIIYQTIISVVKRRNIYNDISEKK
ncbi:hypothetical protein T233_00624 [Vagococcus lutrae LBD1]|uniref:Bacterial sugar transferase domain-containing protein n=1 Tax=Vagococcus lutrae LBD1 TaxID=1408226 RepID=V6Q509_9ENTE|nr:sugar transferase [Vagococcus lutrae]EST90321.1 hypothetical protein T233_00624 [Vagococcus lutrae LBD1]